jgi:hypothetical protein
VAGKTFSGVGGENSTPDAYEDDARGVYSGPTVVDDRKVEAGLEQLRSLDRPPGPLTGITKAVVDPGSGEPTQVAELASYNARPTAVGRSASAPAAQPVTIPVDAVRGTMFGHSIHLPDINAPDSTMEELSSGSVQVIDSESGPQPVQPFPLAEPMMRAAAQRAAAARAAAPAPVARSLFADVDADVRIDANIGAGGDAFEVDTDVVVPRRRWPRIAAVVAGLGMLGGAAVLLFERGSDSKSIALPPPAATAPASAPTEDPPPVKTVQAPTPAPAPAAAQAPAAAEMPPPAEIAPAPEPAPPPVTRANADVADELAPKRKPAAQRSDTKVGPAAEAASVPRPNRARRRPIIREDPDATMAPTLD